MSTRSGGSSGSRASIREMKAAIVNASLNTEDLVERSHVEERYEEALALMPLAPAPAKEPEESSRARGLRQANAAKNGKVAAAPKQRPPAENASGWWRMEDLSAAFKKYTADPNAPEANYFMGKALQMGGQTEQADEQYGLFYDRCVAIHGRAKALKFYESKVRVLRKKQAAMLLRGAGPSPSDAKKLEDYEMMAAAIPRVEAERAKRRKMRCVVA